MIQPSNQETTSNQITNNCCEEIKKVVSDKGIGEANLKINNRNPDHLVPHIFDENHNFIALDKFSPEPNLRHNFWTRDMKDCIAV